ncbi:hypothetical protein B0A48_00049 [Cryoendolithus antarcticus]|uniref:Xylanolytic transcriptional activator regulatory domain-containing protein n=1 Tax=Cryoendolithus antarcticus TaxID=1507870 RepID=A0A1V8TTL0_9PEZI|nr:hypothetical protein B0A48_00049 [Cryoendolithus antarcticus]
MTDGQDTRGPSRSRISPELDATEIGGQYVDTTSDLSFLARARKRLIGFRGLDTESQYSALQPLTTAGDKPMVTSNDLPVLPDDYEAPELLDLYFDVCIATYKPLHRPTVDRWYAMAQSQNGAGNVSQVLGHAKASVLLCIFAVVNFHRQKARGATDDVTALTISDAYFQQSAKLTETETGAPHLESAQARLIQVLYLLMMSRVNQAWYIFGNLLQILSAMGMHRRDRKRSIVDNRADYIHKQCRKRVFWCAYTLDKYLGVVLGRPRHFHDDDIDQDYPDCVNYDDMTPTGRTTESNNEGGLIDGFVCNAKLSRIVGKISRELYSIKSTPERNRIEATQRLTRDLDEWYASLPSFISSVRPSILPRRHEIPSIDREKLTELAESCLVHLAQATASNSPSRRYSIILEELRMEAAASGNTSQRSGERTWVPPPPSATSYISQTSPSQIPLSTSAHTGSSHGYADMLDLPLTGLFQDWQTSDWLDLDASAFGTMSGSSPDMQWFDDA